MHAHEPLDSTPSPSPDLPPRASPPAPAARAPASAQATPAGGAWPPDPGAASSASAAATTDDGLERALVARLRLARARGVGPRTARLLLERAGSVEALFAAAPGDLLAAGVPEALALAVLDPRLEALARAEVARVRALGGAWLAQGLPGWPDALRALDDPPLALSCLGGLTCADARAVAIVGARRATPAGQEVARRLARELAHAGVTVVSGLARGVDAAAHEGALEAGGRTIAVLGTGLDRVYPPQHLRLAARVAARGALLSEEPPGTGPSRWSFPRRNRIVAGLSLGVVVVEAGPRSGALITADLALQQGREVFAVPGSVLEPLARGSNRLIRDGAHLVESADDVLDVLFGPRPREDAALEALLAEPSCERPAPPRLAGGASPRPGPSRQRSRDAAARVPGGPPPTPGEGEGHGGGGGDAQRVLAALEPTRGRLAEDLARSTGLDLGRLVPALARLELLGAAARAPDGWRAAAWAGGRDVRA